MNLSQRGAALFSQHGRALLEIAIASAFGILASAGLQIVATQGLGPAGFGLLASFLAVINVAAIGSAALRNSVAVMTAAQTAPFEIGPQHTAAKIPRAKLFDSAMVEALLLGGACTIGILAVAPWLATSLNTQVTVILLTAAAIAPYFLFARAQGLLQGAGDTRAVVWWTTGTQITQLLLAVLALALGLGATGILVAYVLTVILGMIGASYQSRRLSSGSTAKPFSKNSTVVILLTIAFAWLTNADMILVRSGASEVVAGSFAAAAVLIKTTLILPATLSLYLLPRFVSLGHDAAKLRLGVNLTLAVTLLSGLAMFLIVLIAGDLIVSLLFGTDYEMTVTLLPGLALMWLPWAMAQAVLVRITAAASKSGLAVLLLAAVVQWFGASALLPDIWAMIIFNGSLGLITLAALFAIHLLAARKTMQLQ